MIISKLNARGNLVVVFLVVTVAILLLLLIAFTLFSKVNTFRFALTGKVFSGTGDARLHIYHSFDEKPLLGATVTLFNDQSHLVRGSVQTTTVDNPFIYYGDLDPGVYTAQVAVPGYSKTSIIVPVYGGKETNLPIRMIR